MLTDYALLIILGLFLGAAWALWELMQPGGEPWRIDEAWERFGLLWRRRR